MEVDWHHRRRGRARHHGDDRAAERDAAAYAEDCSPAADACLDLSAGVAWLMHNDAITYGGVPMPYSVFFTESGIAFHEGSLTNWSHGCIHLSPEAARMFFNTLRPGDVVEVIP